MALTAAVIGCGNISRFHFSGLGKCGVKIGWVCDLDLDKAAGIAKEFGAQSTDDYRKIIADPSVDLVNITPISSVHKEMCLAAIDAGKAVICEKTLSESAADSWDIVSRAEEAGTVFYTSYMKRFLPAVVKAKELMPGIGRIITTYIRAFQPWGDLWSGNPKSGFAHTPPGGSSMIVKNYGGGILVCGGSHILDLVCFFLGRPQRLYASMYTPEDRDYDLRATALLETANGPVHYEAIAHPLTKIGFLKEGWEETIEITGTRGRLTVLSPLWDQGDIKGSRLIHYNNDTETSTEYCFAPVSPFDSAMRFFCDNIAAGTQGTQSRLTGYEVDELIEHIKLSAASGQAVEVAWMDQ